MLHFSAQTFLVIFSRNGILHILIFCCCCCNCRTYSARNEVDENISMEDLKLVHKLPARYFYYDTYKAEWKNTRGENVVVFAKIFSR